MKAKGKSRAGHQFGIPFLPFALCLLPFDFAL
jgi:hypothetical protein